jgi:hypothetical protein
MTLLQEFFVFVYVTPSPTLFYEKRHICRRCCCSYPPSLLLLVSAVAAAQPATAEVLKRRQ